MEGNLKEINIKEIEDLKKKINEKYNTTILNNNQAAVVIES